MASGKKPTAPPPTKHDPSKSKTSHSPVQDVPQGKAGFSSTVVVGVTEAVLPDNIDAELDVEVESDGDITLESLATDLDADADDLDVDDLDDAFSDDDFRKIWPMSLMKI